MAPPNRAADRIGAVARSGAEPAIVGDASLSCAMVAFAIDRILVWATCRGWQLARGPLGNCRQRRFFSYRRLAKSARNSGTPPGYLGYPLRFRTRRAEFLSPHV